MDLSVSGNCNPSDGKCLQCIYNTVGDHCEYCEPGYFGDAINLSCAECTCNVLGTADPYPESGIDKREHNCDRDSGVCRCLPNVQGDSCDKYEIFSMISVKMLYGCINLPFYLSSIL